MAASNFEEALRRVLAHEGGFSNHPSDPGGATKFGITIHDYRRYAKPFASVADVKAMTLAEAKAIYRDRYWNALRCDRLPAGLDYAVFDYGVNSGTARASRVLRSLARLPASTAPPDEVCITALATKDAKIWIAQLCDERLAFLRRLRTWPVFGRGWERRVAEVRAAALGLAARAKSEPAEPPSRNAPGKGFVPLERAKQRTSAGAIAAGGAVVAGGAQSAGVSAGVIATIIGASALLAVAAWLFWRWRQRRRQMATS